ncbi:sensor histidine kinase [Gorillibacterium timonense]|uniref:sensor histidine kinase n=1 Tax=Gorillibacterium timonense TaxID=1689269 RepID=UPI00071C5832|nr:sensor histidine kinase [Gorillibacterium timonense]
MKLKQRFEKAILRVTRSLSLRKKIVVFYSLIVFIPTILLAVSAGYLALQHVRENYLITAKEAVRQSAESIDFRKQSYDLLANRTATDGELISRLSRSYSSMFEQLETVEYVDRSYLYTQKYLPGIEDFRIYHANASLVQDGGLLWKPENRVLSGVNERDWFQLRVKSAQALMWSNALNDKEKIVVTRNIIDPYGEVFGLVYLLLDYHDVFADSFEHPFNGAGELYIVDSDDRIIASSVTDEISEKIDGSSLQPYWGMETIEPVPINGKLLIEQKLSSGWTVAALMDINRMEQQSKWVFVSIAAGVAFFLMVSIFMILTVLKNVVWRIRKLGARMTDISQGDFDVTVRNQDQDELGELEVLFNSMSRQLRKLVEENMQAHLKEKEQYFRALQAQINPHFIYNSLSLVRWRAMDLQDETQIRTIDALTTFYRIALNNRVNVVCIRDELEHLKAYVEIQQLRYPGRVEVQWEIEPEVLDLYTIKLLLQPIVENSYLHGNITKKSGATIWIVIRHLEDTVHIEVRDNGKGIPNERLEQIQAGRYTGTRNGFGMNNIRERLRLYFGSEGLMRIESVENEWTSVVIQIPACWERPEIKMGEDK